MEERDVIVEEWDRKTYPSEMEELRLRRTEHQHFAATHDVPFSAMACGY